MYYVKINDVTKNAFQSSAVRVKVQGEVLYPGEYLLENGETLSSLISRAGGVTKSAFLNGAVFTRENVRQREALRARQLADDVRRAVVSASQTQSDNQINQTKKTISLIT